MTQFDRLRLRTAYSLTAQETEIADALFRANGRVLSRSYLDDAIPMIRSNDRNERCIDTAIWSIRRKLGRDSIETIRSMGWRMTGVGLGLCRADDVESAA